MRRLTGPAPGRGTPWRPLQRQKPEHRFNVTENPMVDGRLLTEAFNLFVYRVPLRPVQCLNVFLILHLLLIWPLRVHTLSASLVGAVCAGAWMVLTVHVRAPPCKTLTYLHMHLG
ncbi:hypothetical protein J3E68DRAFT_402634 [Trichoderma sp. SZMC 28012]